MQPATAQLEDTDLDGIGACRLARRHAPRRRERLRLPGQRLFILKGLENLRSVGVVHLLAPRLQTLDMCDTVVEAASMVDVRVWVFHTGAMRR
jgi:hypothetical protein